MNPSLILTNVLQRLRLRFLWIHSAAGFAWGIGIAAAVVLLGVWLDLIFEFSPGARIAATVFASLAAIVGHKAIPFSFIVLKMSGVPLSPCSIVVTPAAIAGHFQVYPIRAVTVRGPIDRSDAVADPLTAKIVVLSLDRTRYRRGRSTEGPS